MKKAQVTMFVILGIIILFIVGVFIFITSQQKEPEQQDNLPLALQPVKNMIEQCLYQKGKEAFILLGQHGGYIDPEKAGVVVVPNSPTLSTGLEFIPDGKYTLPYWFYLSSPNNCKTCVFDTKRPPLRRDFGRYSVEAQVDSYVSEHLQECLDYSSFRERNYQIDELSAPKITTTVGEKDVTLKLDYDLQVTIDGQSTKISSYQTKLDVNFKRIYDLATEITQQLEISDKYKLFEEMTMNTIDAYSIGNNPKLPPTTGPTRFDFGAPDIWMLRDVKEELQNLLTGIIPLAQIQNAREHRIYITGNDFNDALYNNFRVPLENVPYEDISKIKVDFSYFSWWPMYLKISPSYGELIMPETSFSAFIIPLAIQRYDFSYSAAYPVAVSLNDNEAFNGEGYDFHYALEVNVRNNAPLTDIPFNLTETIATTDSFFSSLEQVRTGNVTVITINHLHEPVSDVLVSYNCYDESIFMGITQLVYGNAQLVKQLPLCLGGTVYGFKQGYFSSTEPLSLRENESAELTVIMEPVRQKNLKIEKKMIEKDLLTNELGFSYTQWAFKNSSMDLEADEELLLILTRNPTFGQEEFVKFYNLNGRMDNFSVDLVSGTYKIEAYLMRKFGENYSQEKFSIPEKEYCYDTEPLNPFGGEECTTIPVLDFNSSFFLGGVLLDNSTSGYFTITLDDLHKENLTLKLVSVDITGISEMEDLEQIDKVSFYSTNNRTALEPVFE